MRKFGLLVAALALLIVGGCDESGINPNGTTPNIEIPFASKTIGAQKGTFVLNVNSNTEWSITSSAEWLTFNKESFSGSAGVMCSYTENTSGKSRTAKLTITPAVAEASARAILITQSATEDGGDIGGDTGGGGDDGGSDDGDDNGDDSGDTGGDVPDDVVIATVAEFIAAEEDATIYQLSGTIGGSIVDHYGNFDLTDATGTVLIYGLVDEAGERIWDSLGLGAGDEITVRGTRQSYKGSPEMIDALYISSIKNDDGGNDDDGGDDDGGNTGGGGGGIVTDSPAKYAGWAELPAEENNNDYYYAYHMIPDKGNGKVRNFAVCYSDELGCPVWVASPMHSYYTQKNTSRSDAYAPDPDIPSSIQVHKRDGYTRGHMLGSSDRLVSAGANRQAFYYSNIAPQLSSGFNTGGGVWNNLESYCDGQLCADTLYMVNGCYWENYNKKSSGTVIPTHYYKVLLRTKKGNSGKWVVNCSASELKCVVFMVEHNSSQHRVEPHRGMMMSVAELEKMTGHTFFPNVPNAPKDSYNPSDWGM